MPARYGLDGSEKTRSYWPRPVISTSRASPVVTCTRGLSSASAVHGGAHPRHLEDGRLQLDDVGALHARDGGQPPGGAPGAEADDERAVDLRAQQGAQQPAHHLGGRVVAGVAVDLAVHDEGQAEEGLHGDAALDPLLLPDHEPARVVDPRPIPVRAGRGARAEADDPSHADAAVPPRRGRAGPQRASATATAAAAAAGQCARGAEAGAAGAARSAARASAASRSAAARQQPGAVSSGMSPKPPASAPAMPPDGVPEVGETDVPRHRFAALAEQGDEERELALRRRPPRAGSRSRSRPPIPPRGSRGPAAPAGRRRRASTARRSPIT